MSSKPYPRNAREYLFSMESGVWNKTEIFFASKHVLIKIIQSHAAGLMASIRYLLYIETFLLLCP